MAGDCPMPSSPAPTNVYILYIYIYSWEYFFFERKHITESALFSSIHGLSSSSNGDINFYRQQIVMEAFALI